MKNKKKKRGFTLIELLATITILSVVMIIAIPSVTKLIKKFGDNYYNTLEGNVKLAGIDYFTDHKKEIPKYINESSVVEIKDLFNKGYIEETPKDKNGEEITEGYVIAYKTNKGKYEYQACIITKDGEYKSTADYCDDSYSLNNNVILVPPSNGVYALPQKKPGNFDNIITPYAATKQTKESNSSMNPLDPEEDAVAPVKAIVSCENDCNNIRTGEYTGDLKGKLNAIISNNYKEEKKDTYTSWLKGFLKKKIKIKYIYESNGKKAEALFSFVEANQGEIPGEIKVVLYKETEDGGQVYGSVENGAWSTTSIPGNTNLIQWTNKGVSAKVSPINTNEKRIKKYYCESKAKPGNIFECGNEIESTISYTDTNSIIEIYGVNKYGTSTPNKVTYSIKTDKTPPTCQSSGGSNSWTNRDITLIGICSDALSGCISQKTEPLTFNYNYNASVSPGKVSDNAGNETTCPSKMIKIDKTPPTCQSSGGSSSWTKNNVTVTGSCSDYGGSGCASSTFTETKTSNFNGYVTPGPVYDNAGNYATCESKLVKIDKTPPTCQSSGGSSSWTRNNVTVRGTCSDSGGSGCVTSTYTKTISSDYNGSVSPGPVYDNAGNSATCSNKTVKVDKTPPQIEDNNSKGYNAGSCKSFRTHDSNTVIHRFKMVSHDYYSGIDSIYYKYDYGSDPGSSDSGWVEGTNSLYLARSNSYLIDNSYTRIRQDYNLLSSGTAYFRFKLCDNAGNCTGVSDKYTASGVTTNQSHKGQYCRDVFQSGHSGSFIVSD